MRLLALILLLSVTTAFAQLDKTLYYSFGEQIYLDVNPIEKVNGDTTKVLLLAKVVFDAMTFEKLNNIDPNSKYIAKPTFEFIIKDKDGVIRKRFEYLDTVLAGKYEQTDSKKDFYSFSKSVNLQNGTYTVSINLLNKSSRNKIYKLVSLNTEKTIPIFCKAINVNSLNDIEPLIYGGSMPFSSSSVRLIIPTIGKQYSKNLIYLLAKKKSTDVEEYEPDFANLSGTVEIRNNFSLNSTAFKGKTYLNLQKIVSNNQFLDLEISSNKVLPGTYTLKIFEENTRDTLKFDFLNEWFDKPLSLKKVSYAIDCLSYILKDDEIDDMRAGENKENWEKFYSFWSKKDPTPNSLYNEALIQYFTRLDYAFFNFQTLSEVDGSKTDRGKIYILFGEPQIMANSFTNGKSLITWSYPNLKKDYIFELISSGIYKLVQIKDRPKS